MRRLSIAAMTVAVSLTAACSGQNSAAKPAAAEQKDGVIDVSVFHFAHTDYFLAPTPAENAQARWSDVIVSGSVEGFSLGRSHTIGGGSTLQKVVLKVKVDQKVKGDDKDVSDGNVYVELWGGPNAGVDKFNAAIPKGTPVVVFGSDELMVDNGAQDQDAGHPQGATLLNGLHPQSLFFEGIPAGPDGAVTAAADAATVVPAQESLADFGPAWTGLDNLTELVEAAKSGLS